MVSFACPGCPQFPLCFPAYPRCMKIFPRARWLIRLQRLWGEANTDADMHFAGYVAWRKQLKRLGVESVVGLDILDVGGGDRAQLSLLFAADGARVTSLDTTPVALGVLRPRMWVATARSE